MPLTCGRPAIVVLIAWLAATSPSAAQIDSQAVALLGLPFPSVGKYKHRETIRTQYERLADSTRTSLSIAVRDVSAKHILTLAPVKYGLDVFATYPGRELLDYPRVVFLRLRLGENETWLFDGHDQQAPGNLMFVLDDTTRVALRGAIPIEAFLRIVNAEKVEGRLLGATFRLDRRNLEALRDFASRLNPLAPVTP